MERKIKFLATAKRWFDKVNGNTYHSVRITRCKDGATLTVPFQYGYGDQYRWTALRMMADNHWLPTKYCGEGTIPMSFERENNYPIEWVVTDGLKRDCVANGAIDADKLASLMAANRERKGE